MNKRLIFKHKICRRYEEDIWGIFFRKQQRRDFLLKNIGYYMFKDNNKGALWYKFYRDKKSINIVKNNINIIRNVLFSKYLNLENKKDKIIVNNVHYLRTEYFLSFFFGIRVRNFFRQKRFLKKNISEDIIPFNHNKNSDIKIRFKRKARIYIIQDKLLSSKKMSNANFTLDLIPKTNINRKMKIYKSLYHKRISKIWNFRKFYGCLTNKQLKRFCLMSFRKRGDIVANFLILLESRIDTILYRTGFVSSIFEARQIISHKKILVNNKTINIKSYLLQPSDILSIHPNSYNKLKGNLVKRIYDKSIMFYNTNYYETNYKTLNTLFIPKLLKVDEVSYNFELSDKDINSILYYYY